MTDAETTDKPRGMFFDVFELGKELTSARTVTSTDIENFANLTGDFNAYILTTSLCVTRRSARSSPMAVITASPPADLRLGHESRHLAGLVAGR